MTVWSTTRSEFGFDTDHAIVQDVVETEIDPLLQAVRSLLDRVDLADDDS